METLVIPVDLPSLLAFFWRWEQSMWTRLHGTVLYLWPRGSGGHANYPITELNLGAPGS